MPACAAILAPAADLCGCGHLDNGRDKADGGSVTKRECDTTLDSDRQVGEVAGGDERNPTAEVS
jgi:hypothetical protein